MARDHLRDMAKHSSHTPGVGAGEPRASAASRGVEGASATPAADGGGPNLLGCPIEAVDGLAAVAARGAAGDGGSLAPAGISTVVLPEKVVRRDCLAFCGLIRYLARHDQLAWDPYCDPTIHGSHAPRVGTGEPGASAATRRVEGAPAAAPADSYGPDLLGRAVEALEGLADFFAGGAARDRGAVAPPGLQVLLGMEESTPMGSARDWEGTAGSDSADEPRESAVGCAEDPRRAVEAGPDGLAGDGFEVHPPASEAAVTGVAHVSEEPR